jgi:hypothetical protein
MAGYAAGSNLTESYHISPSFSTAFLEDLLNFPENLKGEGHATLALVCSRREQTLWRIQFLDQTKPRRIGRGVEGHFGFVAAQRFASPASMERSGIDVCVHTFVRRANSLLAARMANGAINIAHRRNVDSVFIHNGIGTFW